MTGYFINIHNYVPCEHCRQGYDKITMLCREPYYKHLPFKTKSINLIAMTSPTPEPINNEGEK